ncbi:MAG: c-type cytochrome [Chloroflexota bacterium]
MKLRLVFIALAALLLAACSLSLAEDVTPPPNYVSPTPPPTLGPLFPPEAPSVERGAAIYADKCAPCHGPAGMGDGPDGKQLPVPVPALGLPQFYRPASPADWYGKVTRGNLERFMPPFSSLTEQERWDVVAYARSLHTSPEIIARGKTLFETNCANCPLDFFLDRAAMSALSEDELAALLKNGGQNVTAIPNLTLEEYYAIADYLRTLAYSVPTPTPEPATTTPTLPAPEATATLAPVESALPVPSETPAMVGVTPGVVDVTPTSLTPATAGVTGSVTPTPQGPVGRVSGTITGSDVGGLTVTLHGYDHGDAGPEENLTLTATTADDGSYAFENVEIPENRIFIVEFIYQTVTYQAEMVIAQKDQLEITVPALTVYPSLADFSGLTFKDARFFLTVTDQAVQIVGVYTLYNNTSNAITVESTVDVPFLVIPDGSMDSGFDLTQDSAPLFTADNGFAIVPNEDPYGFVTFYTLPYPGKIQINQAFVLGAASVRVLVPEGLKVESDQLTQVGVQTFQETNYIEYSAAGLQAGESLVFNLSGKPKTPIVSSSDSKQSLLIGVGALGLVLILAGVWMYLRDRNRLDEEEVEAEQEKEDEFETQEELLDAIIALDDLHRAGKIEDDAFRTRRAELKARLKNL